MIDGDTSTYWSPNGTTGRISVKNLDTSISQVKIIELSGTQGTVTSWSLVNNDNGATLASGNEIPSVISFNAVSLKKVNFEINSASDTPKIAEFEVYK
ncbi:hypothetical protein P4S72_15200 [Vibrio sp. PP-XX7]